MNFSVPERPPTCSEAFRHNFVVSVRGNLGYEQDIPKDIGHSDMRRRSVDASPWRRIAEFVCNPAVDRSIQQIETIGLGALSAMCENRYRAARIGLKPAFRRDVWPRRP
jgi:hypothetical protein